MMKNQGTMNRKGRLCLCQCIAWPSHVIFIYMFTYLFVYIFIYLFLERGREASVCGCPSCTPYWGPGPQPRHVPCWQLNW